MESRTSFVRGDIFKTDFSDATVVTTFLLPSMNFRLRATFLAMKPGTRIVANTFGIGDWEPEEKGDDRPVRAMVRGHAVDRAARVGGTWRTPQGDLVVTQKFQQFTGTLARQRVEGRLRGEEITFTVGTTTYHGRVHGDDLHVSATVDDKRIEWHARPVVGR